VNTPSIRPRRAALGAALLLCGCALLGCREIAGAAAVAPGPVPPPSLADLSPQQQALFERPVSDDALAERLATQKELEAVRGWFAPGELEALLSVANRRAAARGEDTLPHCIPLCGPGRAPEP
jgi:hypothetical protein